MTRWISDDEFSRQARELFRNLRHWSGEAVTGASNDPERSGYLRTQVDTGKIAALRRGRIGSGNPTATVAWVIEPFIPETWRAESAEYRALYQAALLYTRHSHSSYISEDGRFGKPVTRLFLAANGGRRGSDEETRANDRRINFLLDARPDELYSRLDRVFAPLMGKSEQPVDWVQLARDIRDWDEAVRLRWARGWFGGQRFMFAEENGSGE